MTSPADLRAQVNSPWDQHTPTPIRHLTDEKIDELLQELDGYARGVCRLEYGIPMSDEDLDYLRYAVERWYLKQATGAE